MNVKKKRRKKERNFVPKSALNIKLDFGYISFEIFFVCGNFEGGLMEDVYIMGRWVYLPFGIFACIFIYEYSVSVQYNVKIYLCKDLK